MLLQIPEQFGARRLARGLGPSGFDQRGGALRHARVRRHDTQEIAVAHHFHARERFRFRAIHRIELRPERRRAHHLPVQHAGPRDVRRILMLSGHDRARIRLRRRSAGHFPLRGGGERDIRRNRPDQLLAFREFAVADGLSRPGDLPRCGRQAGALRIPTFRRKIDEQFARRRRRFAELRGHGWRSAAPERAHVERGEVRIAHHEPDAGQRRSQLLRHSLRERSPYALPGFDLARARGDDAVLADMQPGGEILRQRFAPLRVRRAGRHQHGHAAAHRGQELAAIKHGAPPRCGRPASCAWPYGPPR